MNRIFSHVCIKYTYICSSSMGLVSILNFQTMILLLRLSDVMRLKGAEKIIKVHLKFI
jgi:hypothetical protein